MRALCSTCHPAVSSLCATCARNPAETTSTLKATPQHHNALQEVAAAAGKEILFLHFCAYGDLVILPSGMGLRKIACKELCRGRSWEQPTCETKHVCFVSPQKEPEPEPKLSPSHQRLIVLHRTQHSGHRLRVRRLPATRTASLPLLKQTKTLVHRHRWAYRFPVEGLWKEKNSPPPSAISPVYDRVSAPSDERKN